MVLLEKQNETRKRKRQENDEQDVPIQDTTLSNDTVYMYRWIEPCGLKLMEHAYVDNYAVQVAESLIASNPKYVVWAGDYGHAVAYVGTEKKKKMSYYYMTDKFPTCQQIYPISIRTADWRHFLVNHTRQQYIVLSKYQDIHPMPLLTTDRCNGRGGGDYSGSNEGLCGVWRGELLSIEPASWTAEGYHEVFYKFCESRSGSDDKDEDDESDNDT